MTNESLEQRARELLAAEFGRAGFGARQRSVLNKYTDDVEDCALRAILAALESTPAQVDACGANHTGHKYGPHGPGGSLQCEWCGRETGLPEPKLYVAKWTLGEMSMLDALIAYGQACASARTAPAEGEQEEDAYVIDRLSRLLAEIAVIVNGPEPELTRWSYHDLPEKVRSLTATTAPVVGNVTWPIPEIECIDQYFRSGNSVAIEKATISAQHWHAAMQVIRAAAADAWRWKHIHEYAAEHGIEATSLLGLIRKLLKDHAIDTARPAKAEGDVLLAKLRELVEKWRTASDDAHEEGGHYHAGEVVAYDQCADELENTYHTARTVKAEGDAQDAARYRFARNNMQIAFLNPYRWFPNPLGLDAAIDAAMQEDTARTVSRGDA